jgi:hypothetical protein
MVLGNISTELRFPTNDVWSLDHFRADVAGTKLTLSGDIQHASQLRKLSDTLDRTDFTGTPQISLVVNGDARDIHSFVVRLKRGLKGVGPGIRVIGVALMGDPSSFSSAP